MPAVPFLSGNPTFGPSGTILRDKTLVMIAPPDDRWGFPSRSTEWERLLIAVPYDMPTWPLALNYLHALLDHFQPPSGPYSAVMALCEADSDFDPEPVFFWVLVASRATSGAVDLSTFMFHEVEIQNYASWPVRVLDNFDTEYLRVGGIPTVRYPQFPGTISALVQRPINLGSFFPPPLQVPFRTLEESQFPTFSLSAHPYNCGSGSPEAA